MSFLTPNRADMAAIGAMEILREVYYQQNWGLIHLICLTSELSKFGRSNDSKNLYSKGNISNEVLSVGNMSSLKRFLKVHMCLEITVESLVFFCHPGSIFIYSRKRKIQHARGGGGVGRGRERERILNRLCAQPGAQHRS